MILKKEEIVGTVVNRSDSENSLENYWEVENTTGGDWWEAV